MRKPNIIFILSDQHRYCTLPDIEGCEVIAPNLKRMLGEGISFTNCYSNYPLCSPARAMIMTGRWPAETGISDNDIELERVSSALGSVFKDSSYHTAYIGKWHLHGGDKTPDTNCRYINQDERWQGFEDMYIWNETNRHYNSYYYNNITGEKEHYEGYNATGMTNQCIDYINQYSSDKSFFLWLNLNPPHPPLHDAPKECLKLYDGVELAWRHNIPDDWRMVEKQVPIGAHCKTAMPFGEQYMQYYAHITAIDNEIGRIFDALESTGLASDTIVVYSSDHGEMLGSHGLLRKGVLYKESAQVPFIIWGHFLQNSCHVTHELMCTIDIYPTLLGIAGIPVPSTAKGVDLSPVIFGEEVGGRKEMMHFDKKLRGIRTEDWLYIMNGRCEELYDRRNDPGELNNLANDKTYKEVLEKMRLQSFEDIICSKFKDITIL